MPRVLHALDVLPVLARQVLDPRRGVLIPTDALEHSAIRLGGKPLREDDDPRLVARHQGERL